MSVLDEIKENSRVDVRDVSDSYLERKVIVDTDSYSDVLYRRTDYDTLWLSFGILDGMKEKSFSAFSELYDFLDCHPDVEWHTPVYVTQYVETMEIPVDIRKYGRQAEWRVMTGVKLSVRSKFHAMAVLRSIFTAAERIYHFKFFVHLGSMTVYWKCPKDKYSYKDYEYYYEFKRYIFGQFKVFVESEKYDESMDKTPYDLVKKIHGRPWGSCDGDDMTERAESVHRDQMKFARKCADRYKRDVENSMKKK